VTKAVAAAEGGSVSWCQVVVERELVVAAGRMRLCYDFPEDGYVLAADDLIQGLQVAAVAGDKLDQAGVPKLLSESSVVLPSVHVLVSGGQYLVHTDLCSAFEL